MAWAASSFRSAAPSDDSPVGGPRGGDSLRTTVYGLRTTFPGLQDLPKFPKLDLFGAQELDGEVHALARPGVGEADGTGHDLDALQGAVEHADADRVRAERDALLRQHDGGEQRAGEGH